MKKFILMAFMILFIALIFVSKVHAASIDVSADGAVLMDATTGEILYSKNMDNPYPPASTTKIMTALLTLENTALEDKITVGKNPPFMIGSSIGLRDGEVVTVKDVLTGLVLQSGNDCAKTLAEYISGSEENFVNLMNARAKELGCTDTNFVNSSGLYDSKHKTSAHDLALILKELMKHTEFKDISLLQYYKLPPTNKDDKERYLPNKNPLVLLPQNDPKRRKLFYAGIEGGKDGYTTESYWSYVASASRNGQRLVVTLIHDTKTSCFDDAVKLLDYGFNNFELKKLYSKGEKVTNIKIANKDIPLLAKNDFYFITSKGSSIEPISVLSKNNTGNKNISMNEELAEETFTLDGKSIGTLKLVSGDDYVLAKNVAAKAATTFILFPLIIISVSFMVWLMLRKHMKRLVRIRRKNNSFYF